MLLSYCGLQTRTDFIPLYQGSFVSATVHYEGPACLLNELGRTSYVATGSRKNLCLFILSQRLSPWVLSVPMTSSGVCHPLLSRYRGRHAGGS